MMKASMGEAVQVVGYIPEDEATLGRSKRPTMNKRRYHRALFTRKPSKSYSDRYLQIGEVLLS